MLDFHCPVLYSCCRFHRVGHGTPLEVHHFPVKSLAVDLMVSHYEMKYKVENAGVDILSALLDS